MGNIYSIAPRPPRLLYTWQACKASYGVDVGTGPYLDLLWKRKTSPGYKEPTLTLSNTALMLVFIPEGLKVLCVCFNNRMWCWRLSGLLFSCCLKALSSDLSSTTSKTSKTTSFWHSTNPFSKAWIIILLTPVTSLVFYSLARSLEYHHFHPPISTNDCSQRQRAKSVSDDFSEQTAVILRM